MNRHVAKTLEIARAEIGVREIGSSNTGRRVEEYQASTTLGGTGWPWCSALCIWSEKEAAAALNVKPVLPPTASCDVHLDYARRHNILSDKPQAGDLFLVMKTNNDATHIGFVVEPQDTRFVTVEGNTNTDGSRNGNGVYSLKRTYSSRYKFIRWANLCEPETPAAATWRVMVGSRPLIATIDNGAAWVAAHQWAEAFGFPLGWNEAAQAVTLQGSDVPTQAKLVADGAGINRAWLPVRALAEFSALKLTVAPGVITVTK